MATHSHRADEAEVPSSAPSASSSSPPPSPSSGLLPTKARIALFTVRSFAIEHALPVIAKRKDDAELVCVVTTPGPKSRRSAAHVEVVEALHRMGHSGTVDVICTNQKSRWADLIALYGANLVLVSGFPWLIPPSVLDDPRLSLGVINFHNSHLPRFMGPNAFGWYVVSGEDHVGYCCHRMSADFDTGPILFTETVPLDVNEDYRDLKAKVPPVFASMVDKAITLALRGDPGWPQVGTPSHAPKFEPAFRWIDANNEPALRAHNKVRAHYGERDHPKGALLQLDGGTAICITKTRYQPGVKVLGLPPPGPEGRPAAEEAAAEGTAGPAVPATPVPEQDPDVASLASLTTISSETVTTASSSLYGVSPSDLVVGSGSAHGGGGGARYFTKDGAVAGAVGGGSSRSGGIVTGAPFFLQCADTTLEVLEWHEWVPTVTSTGANPGAAVVEAAAPPVLAAAAVDFL
jgi:methionyl-tRNA formyltransferase